MQFGYKESHGGDDLLTIKTDQNIDIEILFENGDATHIYLDGDEFSLLSDTLYGVFVVIAGNFINLVDLGRKAGEEYDGIMKEVRAEQKAEDDMARELSSPYLTGRI